MDAINSVWVQFHVYYKDQNLKLSFILLFTAYFGRYKDLIYSASFLEITYRSVFRKAFSYFFYNFFLPLFLEFEEGHLRFKDEDKRKI